MKEITLKVRRPTDAEVDEFNNRRPKHWGEGNLHIQQTYAVEYDVDGNKGVAVFDSKSNIDYIIKLIQVETNQL